MAPVTLFGLVVAALLWTGPSRRANEAPVPAETLRRFESLNFELSLRNRRHQYVEAVEVGEQLLRFAEREAGPKHRLTAIAANNLAVAYNGLARYDRALQLVERAAAIHADLYGKNHAEYAINLSLIGQIYQAKGDYRRAISYLQGAAAIMERSYGPSAPQVATALNNLADALKSAGRLREAERLFQRAIRITRKAEPRSLGLGMQLKNIGDVYLFRGDNDRAMAHYNEARAVFEAHNHPLLAVALSGFATATQNAVKNFPTPQAREAPLRRALGYYARALGIVAKSKGTRHPEYAILASNMGLIHVDLGDTLAAARLLTSARTILESHFGPHHPEVVKINSNLAFVHERGGDLAAADRLYRAAISGAERSYGRDSDAYITSLDNYAFSLQARGSVDEVVKVRQELEELVAGRIGKILATGSHRSRRAYLTSIEGRHFVTLSLHFRDAPANQAALDLALTSLLRNKGRLLDADADAIGQLRSRLSPEDARVLDDLRFSQTQLADAYHTGQPAKSIALLEAKVEQLEELIASRSEAYAVFTRPPTIEAVQAKLPRGGALVEYVFAVAYEGSARVGVEEAWDLERPRYLAYVLPKSGRPRFVDLGPAGEVDARIEGLRKAFSDPANREYKERARALDELIMEPVRRLAGSSTTLIVSPDGPLNLVPFGALIDEHGYYQLERYAISYVGTGRELLRFPSQTASRQKVVLVANPDFGATMATRDRQRGIDLANVKFPPLPGTAQEGDAIARIWDAATLRTGADASKRAVVDLAGPRILHVATHGFFLGSSDALSSDSRGLVFVAAPTELGPSPASNPMLDSGLALAGANGSAEGILTAAEVASLNLRGTKLVVLSACETGVGEVRRGDAVYGLRRSLVIAGAQTQVISLWKVDDRATRDLMVAYHTSLARGAGRAEGLRRAQLAALKRKDRSHPYYWAAFIPSGDWRTLEGQDVTPTVVKVSEERKRGGVDGGGCAHCDVGGRPGPSLPLLLICLWAARRRADGGGATRRTSSKTSSAAFGPRRTWYSESHPRPQVGCDPPA